MAVKTTEMEDEAAELGYELAALAVLLQPVLVEFRRYKVRLSGDVERAVDMMSTTGRRLIGFGEPWATAK